MTETVHAIRTFAITSEAWTPIIAPINCDYYAILGTLNGAAVIRSSDSSNSQAQHVLSAGGSYALVVPKSGFSGLAYRFRASGIVMYLKSAGVDDQVIIEFIC
jgi:hypothetical protein